MTQYTYISILYHLLLRLTGTQQGTHSITSPLLLGNCFFCVFAPRAAITNPVHPSLY